MVLLNSFVEGWEIVFEEELVGDREVEGEWTLKTFYIGDKRNEYLGDSIDLTGDCLESELV